MEIITREIDTNSLTPEIKQFISGKFTTGCNSHPEICGHYQPAIPTIASEEDRPILAGTCELTGVACLAVARLMAAQKQVSPNL